MTSPVRTTLVRVTVLVAVIVVGALLASGVFAQSGSGGTSNGVAIEGIGNGRVVVSGFSGVNPVGRTFSYGGNNYIITGSIDGGSRGGGMGYPVFSATPLTGTPSVSSLPPSTPSPTHVGADDQPQQFHAEPARRQLSAEFWANFSAFLAWAHTLPDCFNTGQYTWGADGPECLTRDEGPPPAVSAEIVANPDIILAGESVDLVWASALTTFCEIYSKPASEPFTYFDYDLNDMEIQAFWTWTYPDNYHLSESAYYNGHFQGITIEHDWDTAVTLLATGGTMEVTPTVSTRYVVRCLSENYSYGNIAAGQTVVTVLDPDALLPDLTAGAVTPTTYAAGQPGTYAASLSNIGEAATPSDFWTVFHFDNDADHATYTTSAPIATNPFVGGASRSVAVTHTFADNGNAPWYARACADQDDGGEDVIAEADGANNCGPWTPITNNDDKPDLTAGAVSSGGTTIHAQTPVTLRADLMNIGGGSTVTGFSVLWQYDRDADHTSTDGSNVSSQSAIAGHGAASGEVSATFQTVGTVYARACADANAAWQESITESNEFNNCGAWTALTVIESEDPSVSCSVSPSSVSVGGSATYTAAPASGASGPYEWTASDGGSFSSGSSVTRTFATAGDYGMIVEATGSGSPIASCPPVTVDCATCANSPEVAITAEPLTVDGTAVGGGTTELVWTVSNATSCSLTGSNGSTLYSGAAPAVEMRTQATGITRRTIFTLNCTGAGGVGTASVTVGLIPSYREY